MSEPNLQPIIEHLKVQFRNRTPVLFTGAGFSLGAKDRQGRALPTGSMIAKELWELCLPDSPFDDESSLQDVFELALRTKRIAVTDYLKERLSIQPESLPAFYETYLSLAWSAAYTLNVDDLDIAAELAFTLPYELRVVSSTGSAQAARHSSRKPELEVVHLNGTLADAPDGITFSRLQYADRLMGRDPHYSKLCADLISRPVVFVGTQLDEPPLWQHILLRQYRGPRGRRELRPRSYLVSPSLPMARERVLQDYNVTWVPLTAEEFAERVLSHMPPSSPAAPASVPGINSSPKIPIVSALAAANPDARSEFLLGQEPIWADITCNRAIERDVDRDLVDIATGHLRGASGSLVLAIAGTAGSGKSASLKRLCLALSGEGFSVGFLDKETDLSPADMARLYAADTDMRVIAIDDADRYGQSLTPILDRLAESQPGGLSIVGVRSSKIERVLHPGGLRNAECQEIVMPNLADSDIGQLIDSLDRNNRLGVLKGMSRGDQERAFKKQANRQLLVAMIQATSGRRFEDKVAEELSELEDLQRLLYALVAVGSAARFSLTRDELLSATGEHTNDCLNALDTLVRRGVVVHPSPERQNQYATRHREIARVLEEELIRSGQIGEAIEALAFSAASKASPSESRNGRAWRLVKHFINHGFLRRVLDLRGARSVYELVEGLLSSDYHYWLQRGSLEVEVGDLDLAENFLNQASSLEPDDAYVITEFASLQLKMAAHNPRGPRATAMADDAVTTLKAQIIERGKTDVYPFHVLGSQGLSWVRRAPLGRDVKRQLLREFVVAVERGVSAHPNAGELKQLLKDLNEELLMTHVD